MTSLVYAILTKNYVKANELVREKLDEAKKLRLIEARKQYAAENIIMEETEEVEITRELVMEAPRIKIIRARIRNGKVQRRKRVSNVVGYTMRKKGKGKPRLIRMTPTERRKRRLGQRRGKIKRRQKKSRIKMRLKRANIKRRALGLDRR